MKKDIELNDIISFKNFYESNQDNLVIEAKIKDLGLRRASVNEQKLNDYDFNFNVTVPDVKIYNQRNSVECNIYGFLRVVKDVMRNRGIEDIDLSAHYIAFYDKLEKINSLYNELISVDNLSLDLIRDKVNHYIGNFGTFHFALQIVNKYGMVPENIYNDANSKFDGSLALELLQDKIKGDALSLISLNKEEKNNMKSKLMKEAYCFLAKIYGNPPLKFMFFDEDITPLQFKEKLVGNDLDNFVTVTNFDLNSFFDSNEFIPSIYLNDKEKIIHLDYDKQINAIARQIQAGISVWFSAEESKTLDYNDNILDSNLYDFNKLLNINNISLNEKLILGIINYDHAMAITGVNIENGIVTKFRVDNSFGLHGQFKGKLIMTDKYFKEYVITTIIDKRFIEEN